jgi:hypothetical protein
VSNPPWARCVLEVLEHWYADLLGSWKELDAVGMSRSCRAVRLLDVRAFELKSDVHEVFDKVWNVLVRVDVENHQVCIGNGSELQGRKHRVGSGRK